MNKMTLDVSRIEIYNGDTSIHCWYRHAENNDTSVQRNANLPSEIETCPCL